MARLASERGEVPVDLLREGVDLIAGYVAANEGTEDERREARLDLAMLRANLTESLRRVDDVPAAIAELGRCVRELEEDVVAGVPLAHPLLDHAIEVGERLLRSSSDEEREAARALVRDLESLSATGSAEQIEERRFWFRLRRFVRRAVREGVPEPTLARFLSEALRGGSELPAEIRRVPEVAGLSKALAERATRFPALLAMAVMALSTAEQKGRLDDALENLQELCVAALVDGKLG
jgi:hypothetical protein